MNDTQRTRLDNLLVLNGHYTTRARARDAILRGCVSINGKCASKPGTQVPLSSPIEIHDNAIDLVSRAALKLVHGLEKSGYDPAGRIAVDIGASTGGFTQVLAQNGAKIIYAIDVGHDQMDQRVSSLENVINLEGVNARHLTLEQLDQHRPQFIVCDVSFISLKLALPPALEMAEDNANLIALIKPQFEVGKQMLGKGGIVRDEELARKTANDIGRWMEYEMGWKVAGITESPVLGGDGNREFLLMAEKSSRQKGAS